MEPSRPTAMPALFGGLISAGTFLAAFPLSVAAMRFPPEDGEGGFTAMLVRGGFAMYFVLGVTVLVALTQGILLALTSRAPLLASALPLGAAAPLAVGALGLYNGMRGAMAALVHVSPSDKAVITFAALSEASCCLVFGALCAATLWLGLAAGLGCAIASQREATGRAPLLLAAIAACGLGAWAFVDGQRAGAASAVFSAAAHVDPSLGAQLIADLLPEVAGLEARALLVAAAGVLAFGAVTAWTLSKGGRRAAVAASIGVALTLLCVAGAEATHERILSQSGQSLQGKADPGPQPLIFAGPPGFTANDVVLDGAGPHHEVALPGLLEDARDRAVKWADLRAAAKDVPGESPSIFLGVRLVKGAKTADLVKLIRDAAQLGFERVQLIGQAPGRIPLGQLPRSVSPLRYATAETVWFKLELAPKDAPTDVALIADNGVKLNGQLLPFTDWTEADGDPTALAALELSEPLPSPEQLVRALATLAHAGRRAAITR